MMMNRMWMVGALAGAVLSLMGTGCRSNDVHAFKSAPTHPTTLTIVKTPSQEPIWSYDIPAGYKLVVDFDSDILPQRNFAGGPVPTEMKWSLYGPKGGDVWGVNTSDAVASDVVAMPGVTVAMKITYRDYEAPAEAPTVDGPYVTAPATLQLPVADVEISDGQVNTIAPDQAEQDTLEPDSNSLQ